VGRLPGRKFGVLSATKPSIQRKSAALPPGGAQLLIQHFNGWLVRPFRPRPKQHLRNGPRSRRGKTGAGLLRTRNNGFTVSIGDPYGRIFSRFSRMVRAAVDLRRPFAPTRPFTTRFGDWSLALRPHFRYSSSHNFRKQKLTPVFQRAILPVKSCSRRSPARYEGLKQRISLVASYHLTAPQYRERLKALEVRAADPNFWGTRKAARLFSAIASAPKNKLPATKNSPHSAISKPTRSRQARNQRRAKKMIC